MHRGPPGTMLDTDPSRQSELGYESVQTFRNTARTLLCIFVTAMLLTSAFVSGCASSNGAANIRAREAELISSEVGRSREGENIYFVTLSYDEVSGVHSTVTTQVDSLTFMRCRRAGRLCVVPESDHAVTIVPCAD